MAKHSIYRRLTRRRRTLTGYSQLWLAPDHLLLVRSVRFIEHYQRFALADIQAIVVTDIPEAIAYQVIALTAIISGAALFFTLSSLLAKITIGTLLAIVLIATTTNIARGPRCRCYLQTAVSREILPPVSRLRTARRFLDQVRPAIDAIQGTLAAERFAAIDIPEARVDKPPQVPTAPSYLPEALFGLFLLNSAIVMASIRFPKAQLSGILLTTVLAEVAMLVLALVRRARHDSRRIIYALMIAALLCIGWDAFHVGAGFIGWINGVVVSSRREQPPSLTSWSAFSQTGAIFAATWRIAAGAIGLVAGWFERQ
jgi:hypothetical protein